MSESVQWKTGYWQLEKWKIEKKNGCKIGKLGGAAKNAYYLALRQH